MNEPPTAPDPYEAAVKWIENEVHTHGVFEMRRVLVHHYDHENKITGQVPNGLFQGFSVSSQHTEGTAYNLLQLVQEMQRLQIEIADMKLVEFHRKEAVRIAKKYTETP